MMQPMIRPTRKLSKNNMTFNSTLMGMRDIADVNDITKKEQIYFLEVKLSIIKTSHVPIPAILTCHLRTRW
jgi:hypothetical protein